MRKAFFPRPERLSSRASNTYKWTTSSHYPLSEDLLQAVAVSPLRRNQSRTNIVSQGLCGEPESVARSNPPSTYSKHNYRSYQF
jgi:hypothetical protein